MSHPLAITSTWTLTHSCARSSRAMNSQSCNQGHLALVQPTQGSLHSQSPTQRTDRQSLMQPSSRRRTSPPQRMRIIKCYNDLQRSLEDTTGIMLAENYSGSFILQSSADVSPHIPCHATVGRCPQVIEDRSKVEKELSVHIRRGQDDVCWEDLEEGDKAWPSPPTRPQLRRLQTPELVPVKNQERFCTCCPKSETAYQFGREKMDVQRMFVTWMSLR